MEKSPAGVNRIGTGSLGARARALAPAVILSRIIAAREIPARPLGSKIPARSLAALR